MGNPPARAGLGVSVGVGAGSGDASLAAVFERADRAVSRAKAGGKNRIAVRPDGSGEDVDVDLTAPAVVARPTSG